MKEDNPNEYRNPKRINDRARFLGLPMHHVAIFVAAVVMAITAGPFFMYMGAWLALTSLTMWLDNKFPKGILTHLLWEFGVAYYVKPTSSIPPASNNEYFS